jgi:predicted porin
MKNVSKLALFVAAGMLSAGANANTIQIPEGTTFELEGEFTSNYFIKDAVDTSLTDTDNQNDLEGEIQLDWSAVRSFDNFDVYTEASFEFANQTVDGTGTDFDGAVAGIEGEFGQFEVGHTDNVYEDLITDSVDVTSESGLTQADDSDDEDNMITYYSPETAGFSFNLQLGINDEVEGGGSAEQSFIASAAYDFGAGSIHLGHDDFGITADGDDSLTGIAAVFSVGAAELSVAHEMETNADDQDTDYTGMAIVYPYGMGDVYGQYQTVSPDVGNDLSQYAFGVNAEIEDGIEVFAEYADFDGQDAADADTQITFGLSYAF